MQDSPVGGGVLAVTLTVALAGAATRAGAAQSISCGRGQRAGAKAAAHRLRSAPAPEAVQEVALLEVHVNVEPAPLVTLVGLALIETLGLLAAALPMMVTMAEAGEPKTAPCAWAM